MDVVGEFGTKDRTGSVGLWIHPSSGYQVRPFPLPPLKVSVEKSRPSDPEAGRKMVTGLNIEFFRGLAPVTYLATGT